MQLTTSSRKRDKLGAKEAAALDRKFGKALWGPHPTNHLRAVCIREHESTFSGCRIPKGFVIPFALPEHRDSWLAAQHPNRWGKLLKKWRRKA